MPPKATKPEPINSIEAGSGTGGGGEPPPPVARPALVNGVWPMLPGVAHPLLLPVPSSQEYPIIKDPKAAPLSSIVIGLPLVRLVFSANAYSVKLVGAANPFAVSPPDQLTNDSEPPLCVRPSWSYAVPTDDDVNVAVV